MSQAGRLNGKAALITGAGTGIGRAIALEFAREGADVVLHYAHSAAGAESAAEIRAQGGKPKPWTRILTGWRGCGGWWIGRWSGSAGWTFW